MGGNNLFAVPLAVLAGIPLYADATTIIPIAQVLIDKGAAGWYGFSIYDGDCRTIVA